MCKKSILTLIVVSSLFVVTTPLQATLYPLAIFNNAALAGDPRLSFSVDVLDAGAGKVYFEFHNTSSIHSTIARVYFDDDDDLLKGIVGITNGPGTIFHKNAIPGNLPAGNTLTPPFNADFSAAANHPPAKKGIDPTEWVKITFDIENGHTFSEIIHQMNDGTMRIGAHIISISVGSRGCCGGCCRDVSVSAVTPEPATIALLGLGALGLLRNHSRKLNNRSYLQPLRQGPKRLQSINS